MKKTLFAALAAITMMAGCSPKGPALFDEASFKADVDGKPVQLYTLSNGTTTLQVTNFGGRVVSLFTPDREGKLTSIVVAHDNIQDYITPPGERFLGASVGPVGNRICKGTFELDGEEYHTPLNNNGNSLHGGFKGIDNVVWDVVSNSDTSIVMHFIHADGVEGFPGNLDITMTYALDSEGAFHVDFTASTDKATPVNLTHHPFFCLRGEGVGNVEDYDMCIKASHYIPIDSLSIPTGEIAPVEGTPFDFREAHAIGLNIGADDEQIRNAHGYDHNWCIDKETGGVELIASVYDPVSGRSVEVLTDQPGLQVYTGNFFLGGEFGANGNELGFRSSIVLEAQRWPDAVNNPSFTPSILQPGETYTSSTIYRFGVL
jgi:aldose 1-epimerase